METNKMETRDIFPLLMSMSLPMVLSMLVQSLYNIIDSIYVSYLGTGALTAVSLAFPLQNIVLCRDCFRLIDQSGKKGSETGK